MLLLYRVRFLFAILTFFYKHMAMISKKTAFIWVLILAGAVTLWKFFWKPMEEEKMNSQSPTPSNAMMQKETTGAMMEAAVKTTRIQTSYKNPGGSDEVGFVVMVGSDGVVTDAKAEVLAVNPISKVRQEAFAEAFPAALKGKRLSELTAIDRVGGSSLTTGAFNAALPQLQAQL